MHCVWTSNNMPPSMCLIWQLQIYLGHYSIESCVMFYLTSDRTSLTMSYCLFQLKFIPEFNGSYCFYGGLTSKISIFFLVRYYYAICNSLSGKIICMLDFNDLPRSILKDPCLIFDWGLLPARSNYSDAQPGFSLGIIGLSRW